MSEARRFGDEEIAEILAHAAQSDAVPGAALPSEAGLTLEELQEVGREVGIHPARIAEAASLIVHRPIALPERKLLGAPVSVGRVVELPRALTDREWEVVVGDLRDTFAAAGRLGAHGATREWKNGNLRVLLEPAESGNRLRMTTQNGSHGSVTVMGGALVGISSIGAAAVLPEMFMPGIPLAQILAGTLPLAVMAATGIGSLVWTRIRLPKWARQRASQMEAIAGRARALAEKDPR